MFSWAYIVSFWSTCNDLSTVQLLVVAHITFIDFGCELSGTTVA